MEQKGDLLGLMRTKVEKDLGVYVDDALKFNTHIETDVNKVNKIVELIGRSLAYLDSEDVCNPYNTLIRPITE